MANQYRFAKFAKVFDRQSFLPYGIYYVCVCVYSSAHYVGYIVRHEHVGGLKVSVNNLSTCLDLSCGIPLQHEGSLTHDELLACKH